MGDRYIGNITANKKKRDRRGVLVFETPVSGTTSVKRLGMSRVGTRDLNRINRDHVNLPTGLTLAFTRFLGDLTVVMVSVNCLFYSFRVSQIHLRSLRMYL